MNNLLPHGAPRCWRTFSPNGFGASVSVDPDLDGLDELVRIAGHRVHRRFLARAVEPGLLACLLRLRALGALQERPAAGDILVGYATRRSSARSPALIADMPWIADAPAFSCFSPTAIACRGSPQLRDKPFPNDHLDLFFNAVVDGAIVLATFLRAPPRSGSAGCPISAIRDHARTVQRHAGLAAARRAGCRPVRGLAGRGWPHHARLNLETTLHEDRYEADDLARQIGDYDRRGRRGDLRPPARSRALGQA